MAIPEQLISRLLRLTQQQKLIWEPVGQSSFRAQTGSMTLALAFTGGVFSFTIFDENGNVVDLKRDTNGSALSEFYDVIRRSRIRIDDTYAALDDALRVLEQS